MAMAQNADGSAFYTLNSGSTLSAASEMVANAGGATFTQNGGSNTISGAGGSDAFTLGNTIGGNGRYSLNAGTLAVTATNGMVVGNGGTGAA